MFPKFPYTDFHRLNADWILEKIITMSAQIADALQRVNTAVQSITNCVKVTAQNFTASEKAQARTNIGAAATADIPNVSDVVRTSAQTLTPAAQTQARTNIGAAASADIPNVSDVVRTSAQTLTPAAQTQARTNIGAAASADIPDVSDVVRTSAQTLTPAAQTQARTNIGAAAEEQTVRFIEEEGSMPASVEYPALTADQMDDFRETFNLLKRVSPEALYSIALFGQNIAPDYGWPRVRLERLEDDNGGAYFKISQRASADFESPNTDCRLSGVATPMASNDAVNKGYADGAYLPQVNPYIRLSAANQYPRVGLSILSDNGEYYLAFYIQSTENGPVRTVRVGGVADPVSSNDAVNKAYMDALAPLIITVTNINGTLIGDKTDLQIKNAINNNRQIIVNFSGAKFYCTWANIVGDDVAIMTGYSIISEESCDMIGYDTATGWTKYEL